MRSSHEEQKPDHHVFQDNGQSQMLSRKLRHSKRKTLSYNSLIKLGLIVFGTLFIGLFVLEMVKSQNVPTLTVVEQEPASSSEKTVQAAVPMEKNESQAAAPANQNESQTAVPPVQKESPEAASTGEKSNSQANTQASQTAVKAEPNAGIKKEAAPAKTKAATPVTQPAAKVEPKKAEPSAKSSARQKAIRHVVKQGDTLFKLSRYYYGNGRGVDAIARYNGLKVDGELWVGTVLYIPMPNK